MTETTFRVEPLLPSELPGPLVDLASDVRGIAHGCGANLRPAVREALADVVRVADAWHSGAIEGRHVRPGDLERALLDVGADDDGVLEARALVLATARVDEGREPGSRCSPSSSFLTWAHRAFMEGVPASTRTLSAPDGTTRVLVPGVMRHRPEDDVSVGLHVPPSSSVLVGFVTRLEEVYAKPSRGASELVALACAHQRYAFVHPFPDGNGRVLRLMSRAMATAAGIGAHGLWSLSRGLNRVPEGIPTYHAMLDAADQPRQGDRDGRGNLSESRLLDFCDWFLRRVQVQIRHAHEAFDPPVLEGRLHAALSSLGHGADVLALASVLLDQGVLGRERAAAVLGLTGDTLERALLRLVFEGFLSPATSGGTVRLAFPLAHRRMLFPGLFEEAPARGR